MLCRILDYLFAILEQPEFPRSYSIEFRGPEKIYLPIPGLPKKGVHQLLCLCGAVSPSPCPVWRIMLVWPCRSLSGTTTSLMSPAPCLAPLPCFALGLEGPKWWRLVCDYLDRCDDEHSSLQEKFLHTLFKKYGFTAQSLPVLVHGVQSMQNLKPAKGVPHPDRQ